MTPSHHTDIDFILPATTDELADLEFEPSDDELDLQLPDAEQEGGDDAPASPGERIRTLRDLLGLTQEQLAHMSGVAQSWISDVERASRDANDAALAAIASVTETPVSFFSVRPATIPLDSLRFRKLAGASRIMTRRIHALCGEGYRVSDNLITSSDYPVESLPFTSQEHLTDDEIDELADRTREALRLAPEHPIPHVTRALERAGIAVAPVVAPHGDEDDNAASGGHFGVSYWGGLGSSALIGYFPSGPGDRQRFTLAHEVGHVVLHTFRPHAPRAEAEANTFATALLMPRRRARELISESTTLTGYARLKATWGISIQALIMRAASLELVNETRKRSLLVQLSAKGWRKNEPVEVGHESPLLLWTLLERRYGARPYRSAADDLAIPPAVLRSIVPTPTGKRRDADAEVLELGDRSVVDITARSRRTPGRGQSTS